MKKRAFFWILAVLLVLPITTASNIELTEAPFNNIIIEEGAASFSVNIKNNQNIKDSFRFELPTIYGNWRIESFPAQIVINDYSSKSVELKIIPVNKPPKPDNYGFGIKVISNTNASQFVEHTFVFKVVTYDEAIKTTLSTPVTVDANRENLFRLQLENKYDTLIDKLTVVLESEYFSEEKIIALQPYETVTKDFVIELEPPVEHGDAEIEIKFFKDDEEVLSRTEIINIGDLPIIDSSKTPLSEFLLKKEKIVRTNTGNLISNEVYIKKIGFFEKLFTTTNIKPNEIIKQGNEYLLKWEFELSPGETRIIEIEANYRYFVLALIILIALIYFIYRVSRRDIHISKKLVWLRRSKEGISSMNIQLSIKNISNNIVNNVKVMDQTIRTIERPTPAGPIEPTVIQSGLNITRMLWEIKTLGKGEEVILSYTIKTKIPLLEDIKLPRAVGKYIKGRRRYLTKSNKVSLFS